MSTSEVTTPSDSRLRAWLRIPAHALRQLGPYTEGNRGRMVGIGLTALFGGFIEAAQLYLVVAVATGLAAGSDSLSLDMAAIHGADVLRSTVLALSFVLLVILVLLAVVNSHLTATVQSRALRLARRRTFSAFIRATWSVQSIEAEGRLQQLLTGWVTQIGNGSLQFTAGITAALSFLAYLIAAFALNPVASAAVIFGVVVVGVFLVPLMRASRRLARRTVGLNERYARHVAQAVRLSREVQVFDVGAEVDEEASAIAAEAEDVGRQATFVSRMTPSVYQYSALLLLLVGMALLGSIEDDNLGEVGAIVILMVRSLTYGQRVVTAAQKLVEVDPMIERVGRAAELYGGHQVERGGVSLAAVDAIELDGVDFAYGHDELALLDVDLRCERGAVIGLVGPSGSGKSTLTQILLRLRAPAAGQYRVNGRDASSFALDDWYDAFAFVPQENHLLTGSIAENIRFFRDDISDEEVEAAARAAHLHDDIMALSDGYATAVGPGERDLSGGQKQRLGLARGLAGRPSVLILDEPTSALDMRSEELIQRTLGELKGSVTLFVIAHRMSTLSICDRIVVLEEGRIVSAGTHDELVAKRGFYFDAMRLAGFVPGSRSPRGQ
jgi:ATP-binding cassette subfamily B protein